MADPRPRPLNALCTDAGIDWTPDSPAEDVVIRNVVTDSRAVTEGALFIAIPGTRVDGRTFIAAAIAAGAAAVVMERDTAGPQDGAAGLADPHGLPASAAGGHAGASARTVPSVVVPHARTAAAHLAAAWYGQPARRMRLFGITGTVGKTSVLSVAEALLHASGVRVASIGSLGLRIACRTVEESSYTVPEPLLLHRWLAHAADAGCESVVMEVTSHALVQQRVAGLRFDAGAFTNLVPLEHAEFHASFRSYVSAKATFLQHLAAAAPLAFNADDRVVAHLVQGADVRPIGCGASRTADVRVEDVRVSPAGTRFVLNARHPVPRAGAGDVAPFRLPLELSLLGRSNLLNVALGTVLAAGAGADVQAAARILPGLAAPHRRMQLLRTEPFLLLDDTVGHPDSLGVVFETAGQLEPRNVHVVWAVRGRRGPRINRHNAEALAIWSRRVPIASLIVTRSTDTADAANRVSDDEYAAFLQPLHAANVAFTESAALDNAVHLALSRARPHDLVLLLGAQGMNEGAAIAERWLQSHPVES